MPRPLLEKTIQARLDRLAIDDMAGFEKLVNRVGVDWKGSAREGSCTFVHHACWGLNLAQLAFLVDRGAPLSVKDFSRETPLHWLLRQKVNLHNQDAHAELATTDAMASLLVEHGAKVTPGIRNAAFAMGLPRLVRLVLDLPPSRKDPKGLSPLHHFLKGFVEEDFSDSFPGTKKRRLETRQQNCQLSRMLNHFMGRVNPATPPWRWEVLDFLVEREAFSGLHELSGEFLDTILEDGGYGVPQDFAIPGLPNGLVGAFGGTAMAVHAAAAAAREDSTGLKNLRIRLNAHHLARTLPDAIPPAGAGIPGRARI
jgi:hypothetical protein